MANISVDFHPPKANHLSVKAVARLVSAAFWIGVLAGAVAACSFVLMSHYFLGLQYGFVR
jgi:hypothetical protein